MEGSRLMVAYSFKKQFGPPILAGAKAQTIRAERRGRSRHARPSEELQLYTGMRTKHCRLLGRPTCTGVIPIRMRFTRAGQSTNVWLDGRPMAQVLLDPFARSDGFASVTEMRDFWFATHPSGTDIIDFTGVLIIWTPLAPADALDIGAAAA
jgi:hypothetical protein